jgi:hypothetical protein
MILDEAAVCGAHAGLKSEFARGCAELVRARLQQAEKDTPANRELVAARRSHIDEILDTLLEMRHGQP